MLPFTITITHILIVISTFSSAVTTIFIITLSMSNLLSFFAIPFMAAAFPTLLTIIIIIGILNDIQHDQFIRLA